MRRRPSRASQRVLEEAPREVEKRLLAEQWLAENRQAIAAYNEHVEAHGVWRTPTFLALPPEPE